MVHALRTRLLLVDDVTATATSEPVVQLRLPEGFGFLRLDREGEATARAGAVLEVRAIPRHTMPYHAIPCHTMPYHDMSCYAMPCHTIPCHIMPCHAMSCHAIPWHGMPYQSTQYHAMP